MNERQQGRRSVGGRSLSDAAASPSDSSLPLRRTGLRNPVVFVLLAAGVGDAVTGNAVDALLLLGVGVALARSGKTPRGEVDSLRRTAPRGGRWILLAVATGLAYALVVGGLQRYSWPVTLAVVVPGAVALTIAWREPMSVEPPPIDPLGARLWVGVFVALGLWELANLVMQPSLLEGSYDHPTLSVLSDSFLASQGGRSVALFAWLGFGWYLVER